MQIFVNGVISGFSIAMLGIAFATVYVPTRVFFLALGAVYVAVPFVVWEGLDRGWAVYVAVPLALLTGIALAVVCEAVNHGPLERKKAGFAVQMISSLGIYIIIIQTSAMIWGNETKVLRSGVEDFVSVGNIVITQSQLISISVSIIFILAFFFWLRFTNLGLQFRALAENPKEFALRGFNTHRTRFLAFAVSGFIASANALVVANDIGFNAKGGLTVLLLAVVAAIIGGRNSFVGPLLGGLLLGIMRSEVAWFLSSRWVEPMTFLLLAVFVFAKPNGLISKPSRIEGQI